MKQDFNKSSFYFLTLVKEGYEDTEMTKKSGFYSVIFLSPDCKANN